MCKGLVLKIGFNFGLRVVIGLLDGLFGGVGFMKVVGNVWMWGILIVMIIYRIVYLIFGMIWFIEWSGMIKDST